MPHIRTNADATGEELNKAAMMSPCAKEMLTTVSERFKFSARGYHRVMRVAPSPTLRHPADIAFTSCRSGQLSSLVRARNLGPFRFDDLPDFFRYIDSVKPFKFLNTCRGGYIDFSQVITNHINPNKNLSLFAQKWPIFAQISIPIVRPTFSGRPPTCMLDRVSPLAGTRLIAPTGSPLTRITRLSPLLTSGRNF